MEMVQFHPTGMLFPEEMAGTLVTEAVRGEEVGLQIRLAKDSCKTMTLKEWNYLQETKLLLQIIQKSLRVEGQKMEAFFRY